MTFTVETCRCIAAGDAFIIEGERTPGGAYRDCLVCHGAGSVARACGLCGQTGQRRAQVVLSMVNLDTGRVASANLVPGVVDPQPWPDGGGWHLPVGPLIRGLADLVGAASWRDLADPGRPQVGPVIFLPGRWRPDLPEPDRRALEAQALAAESQHPWHVFLGRTAPASVPDPDRELGRLCRAADLLRLDLVVEARRRTYGDLSWDIRYETPGADMPVEPRGWADDLPAAVAATSIDDALYGLDERSRTAPAHYPSPDAPTQVDLPGELRVDVDKVERRIVNSLTNLQTGRGAAGAQAIWRSGRWWYTRLQVGGTQVTLVEQSTGQIGRRRSTILLRNWEPALPAWLGAPIPHHPCPDCAPGSRLQVCWCTRISPPVAPACPTVAPAGTPPAALRHLRGQPPRLPRSQHHHQRPDQPGSAPGVAGR